jgi:hypothetical protein
MISSHPDAPDPDILYGLRAPFGLLMTPVSLSQAEHCIAEAAQLVKNDPGAAERLLAAHVPGPDGRCTGCGRSMTRWPCVLVMIARAAQELRAGRRR